MASVRPPVVPFVGSALGAVLLLMGAQVAGASPPATGLHRADVPIEQSTRTTLPSDSVDVRIAMTENDTSSLVVSDAHGLVATGATHATAVTYTPEGSGKWTVATGTSCSGPWTAVQGTTVQTPVVQPPGTTSATYCSSGSVFTVRACPAEL